MYSELTRVKIRIARTSATRPDDASPPRSSELRPLLRCQGELREICLDRMLASAVFVDSTDKKKRRYCYWTKYLASQGVVPTYVSIAELAREAGELFTASFGDDAAVERVKRRQPRLDGYDVIILNWDVANGDFAFGADKALGYFETRGRDEIAAGHEMAPASSSKSKRPRVSQPALLRCDIGKGRRAGYSLWTNPLIRRHRDKVEAEQAQAATSIDPRDPGYYDQIDPAIRLSDMSSFRGLTRKTTAALPGIRIGCLGADL